MSCCLWPQGDRGTCGAGRMGSAAQGWEQEGGCKRSGVGLASRAAPVQEQAWRPPQGEWRRGQGVRRLQRAAVALAKGKESGGGAANWRCRWRESLGMQPDLGRELGERAGGRGRAEGTAQGMMRPLALQQEEYDGDGWINGLLYFEESVL